MFAGNDMKGLQAKYKWRNSGLYRKVLGRRAGACGRFGDGNKFLGEVFETPDTCNEASSLPYPPDLRRCRQGARPALRGTENFDAGILTFTNSDDDGLNVVENFFR